MAGLADAKKHYSNDMPTYKGKGGCHVTGFVNQCDGQPCAEDDDCASGCCGHFVSFSLRRCLPLTEDEMCPRFIEPTQRSPVPSQLPPIESTINDMYDIQDRISLVEQHVYQDNGIEFFADEHLCRSHGDKYLCDGFKCEFGSNCQSGCCGQFGSQKEDYCLPLLSGFCPSGNISYGPYGINNEFDGYGEQEEDSIPIPPEFDPEYDLDDATKKENAFWAGVMTGVAIWVFVLLTMGAIFFCYKKGIRIQTTAPGAQADYQDLPSSRELAQAQQYGMTSSRGVSPWF